MFIGLSLCARAQNWQLVWSDEFNYSGFPNGNWSPELWNPGVVNNEWQSYTNRTENARVENGVLVIEARRDYHNGHEYSSARLNSTASWTYGRFEARMKLPGGWGTWPAFWLYPDNDFMYGTNPTTNYGWPNCGEIDIMEQVGYEQNVIHASVHSECCYFANGTQRTGIIGVSDPTTGWHTYACNWFPDRLEFFVDNTLYFTVWNDYSGWQSWPFNHNFHIILNLAVGGDWGGAQGVDPNIWPRRLEVDYVRVYEEGASSGAPVGSTIWLRGNNGLYVSSENGQSAMMCNRGSVGGWEQFNVVDAGNGRIALQGSNGLFVSSENGQTGMMCNRNGVQGWETFGWVDMGNGTVALQGTNGQFVSSENGQVPMMCNRGSVGGWEVFSWGTASGSRLQPSGEVVETAVAEFLIYPNPIVDEFTVDLEMVGLEKGELSLSDLSGRVILKNTLSNVLSTVKIPALESGVYLVTVQNSEVKHTQRVIVK